MRIKQAVPILLILALLSGCAALGLGTKDFTSMSSKEKATFFMGIYNRQYNDYKTQVGLSTLTPEQKKVLVVRKEILLKAYPLIAGYDLIAAGGQIPLQAQEDSIMSLLNQLGTYLK
jgi:hypothetical protein